MDDHLAYEVEQLRADVALLQHLGYDDAMFGATPTNLADGVMPFEAALIHLRNLMEFLLRSPHHFTHPATLQPEHFGVMNHPYADARHRFEDWTGKDPDDLFADICTFVSHLSVNREQPEEGPPQWDLSLIADAILDELAKFVEAVEAIDPDSVAKTRVALDGV